MHPLQSCTPKIGIIKCAQELVVMGQEREEEAHGGGRLRAAIPQPIYQAVLQSVLCNSAGGPAHCVAVLRHARDRLEHAEIFTVNR